MIIHKKAHPRAALVGNPSDGYFGKTIAFTFKNFFAEVTLYESPELEIIPSTRDHCRFADVHQLVDDVDKYGYYGGIRLLKASIKRFYDYCRAQGWDLNSSNFTVRYTTTIPPHLGLAGSSAIITACFRALLAFYELTIDNPVLANLVLSVETEELGIPAGLQDRVAQVYDRPVYMNFDRKLMESRGYGEYEVIAPDAFPSLYIAYRAELSQGSEITHNNLRYRYRKGEQDVLDAIRYWSNLTETVKNMLGSGTVDGIGELLNANFDTRRKICDISSGNRQMVDAARTTGASAKFTGSGGAIIGTYSSEEMFEALVRKLGATGVNVIKPQLTDNDDAQPGLQDA